MYWWIVLFLLGPASVPRAQELKFTKTPESTNRDIIMVNIYNLPRLLKGKYNSSLPSHYLISDNVCGFSVLFVYKISQVGLRGLTWFGTWSRNSRSLAEH